MFIDGVAAPETVKELAARLDALDIDALLGVGILEEGIVDAPSSPSPSSSTRRGRTAFPCTLWMGAWGLLVDGIPVGLVLPVTFAEFMKVTGDANLHYLVSSVTAAVRYFPLR